MIILDYPGRPSVIRRIIIRRRQTVKVVAGDVTTQGRGWSDVKEVHGQRMQAASRH